MADQQDKLVQKIEHLETQIAFLEDNQEQLNQALVSQQQQISDQQYSISLLVKKLKSAATSQMASEADETPPPHY